ncbi:MAG: BREX-1 system adenine-specific DNA-methyltransferase PglX, partial [Aestuariivita sp.]|nr:BREX-1 system adenine-specific DNA-methyltransferase PglX [Aestuariivita sp.]
ARQRRFFNKGVKPNICVLEAIRFDEDELDGYMNFIGRDLFTESLQTTLCEFEEAENFGSLIRPTETDITELRQMLEAKNVSEQLFLSTTHKKVLRVLQQVDYLNPNNHVVIANPPYMGRKGMNRGLASWLRSSYPDAKSDLFSASIVRNIGLTLPKGQLGFMSPFVWMFISTHEKLRKFLLNQKTITSLVQLEYSGFDGATVPVCAFTVENSYRPNFMGSYVRLSQFRGSINQGPRTLEAIKNPSCSWFHHASAADIKKIPGSPIAYWASQHILSLFDRQSISNFCSASFGIKTGNNDYFMRHWFEVKIDSIFFKSKHNMRNTRWYPCASGGSFRKWYGNQELVVDYEDKGDRIKLHAEKHGNSYGFFGRKNYFKRLLTWPKLTSGINSFRITPPGQLFDGVGLSASFSDDKIQDKALLFLNSCVSQHIIPMIAPTMSLTSGDFLKLPFVDTNKASLSAAENLINMSKSDWDSYETSWNFASLPIIKPDLRRSTLRFSYDKLRSYWRDKTFQAKRLEEENNYIFINACELQNDLNAAVPLSEITLTCNPRYRYGAEKTEQELEKLLLADTMRELISYAVGCMFGRYSLDRPGLILANQGETMEDYMEKIPDSRFPADGDNVIPMLSGNWFPDDITERFCKFLRITFGDEHYEENLRFVEDGLNIKGRRNYGIRDYFLGEFYADHVKCYKKRPIYWLFSSPKGSFNALIYMHRYRPETVSIVLNDYLREFRAKLASHKSHLEAVSISAGSSQGEKTKALKEIEKSNKMIVELEDYERDVLYPLATRQIEIDLDDGVKVNYPNFGSALKKIPGLSA